MCISAYVIGKIRLVRDLFSPPPWPSWLLEFILPWEWEQWSQPSSFGAVHWQGLENCWWQSCVMFSQILTSFRWGRHEAWCPHLSRRPLQLQPEPFMCGTVLIKHAMLLQSNSPSARESFKNVHTRGCWSRTMCTIWKQEELSLLWVLAGDTVPGVAVPGQSRQSCHSDTATGDLAWAQHPWVLTNPCVTAQAAQGFPHTLNKAIAAHSDLTLFEEVLSTSYIRT